MKMKTRRGRITILGLCLIVVLAGVIVTSILWFVKSKKEHSQRLERLICQTDYQALLAACRKLGDRVSSGNLKPGHYWVRVDREPKLPGLPQIIVNVEPIGVHIDSEGWVMLEMGGIPSFGVVAYPGTSKAGYSFQGDVELAPGLWYYDEDFNTGEFPKHQERIEALIEKGKARNAQ
jgi:hypothetical protein